MKRPDYTLYLVTDRSLAGSRPVDEIVIESVKGGVTMVQLREKELGAAAFLREAIFLKKLTDEMGVPLIINDRIDIAMASSAAGVHLGQDDMPCALARKIVGDRMIVGVSVSTCEEALEAQRDGADYVAISPVFSTPTKPDASLPVGIEGVRGIRERIGMPIVAIGGIGVSNAIDIVRAGVDGIAVISAIIAASSPQLAAAELISAINEGRRCNSGTFTTASRDGSFH